MRKIVTAIVLLLAMCATVIVSCTDGDDATDEAVTRGIEFFQGTWDEALAKANKENKMVFLDAYATWCGPCKKMKRNVFTDTAVAAFFNKNFVNVAADMEKGEGVTLADKFGVDSYPTLLFTNGDGMQLGRESGYHDPEELIALAKTMLENRK
jgi:thiol:disulfide interchange protein